MPQRPTPPPRLPPRPANDLTADPPARSWSVRLIRKRSQLLGYVTAPDRDAAEAIAVEQLGLTGFRISRALFEVLESECLA